MCPPCMNIRERDTGVVAQESTYDKLKCEVTSKASHDECIFTEPKDLANKLCI